MNILIYISLAFYFVDCKKNIDGHSGQKKQFVSFGDGGEGFSKSGFGGFEGGGGNYQGMFGGGEENEEAGGYGGMQLSENNMGGLNLQGNGMGNYGSFLPANQFGGNEMGNEFIGGGGQFQPYEGQNEQSLGSFGSYGQAALGRGESMFSSMDGGNDENDDILSPFDANSLEGKLEHSINLGDNINTPGVGQFDMSAFDEFGGKGGGGRIAGTEMSDALQSDNSQELKQHKGHKQGDDRQGIGNGEMQDLLSNELGELDTSDEKLQKMLESGLNGDNGFGGGGGGGGDDSGNAASTLNALLSGQSQMDSQSSNSQEELPNSFGGTQDTTQQQNALNQLSGTISQGGLSNLSPVTVHAHASDKPGSDSKDTPPPEESRQTAQQVQETASKQHKQKLTKLKTRLKLLREKLAQLEEEQAKKSTSNNNNDPKQARNDAIKKLLIKNLKLAAMIASKEIQLEEAKGKGLAYLSGKKEEDLELADDSNHQKPNENLNIKSKPLTELSKKAEEEVNHLSKNPDIDKKTNLTANNKVQMNNNITNNTFINTKNAPEGSNTFLRRINETLQVLDKSSPEVHTRSTLTEGSRNFLNRLQKQIQSMTSPQAHVVEEKALTTLYRAIKAKAINAAKRRLILKQRLQANSHSKDSSSNT